MTSGVILDAGALIALERSDRQVLRILDLAHAELATVTVPAGAFAQVIRDPARQVRLSRLLRRRSTSVVGLDQDDATVVGRALAASGTSDVVDAHVVVCAQRAGQAVVTSDPDDLRRIDPTLRLITI
ncbi:PIN domain-containing protein [Sporichthya sp.]|uniref:PIN domain-containing protein n=1 Tax=Sporichthya sp. TaxID=65475 RepID=UPI0017E8F76B|nr:PIN domain-containing protein [Sporichthya sp.]MBA3741877.1 PIN domain-containing protein [Sporichthya sp.]